MRFDNDNQVEADVDEAAERAPEKPWRGWDPPKRCPECGSPVDDTLLGNSVVMFACGTEANRDDRESPPWLHDGSDWLMCNYAADLRFAMAGLMNSLGMTGTGLFDEQKAIDRLDGAIVLMEESGSIVAEVLSKREPTPEHFPADADTAIDTRDA